MSQLEAVVGLLSAQSSQPSTHWPTAYSLLLWLSILVLIPFDLLSVDSSSGGLIGRLTALGRLYPG